MAKKMLTTILCACAMSACATPETNVTHLRGMVDGKMLAQARDAVARGVRTFTIESSGGYVMHAHYLALALQGTQLTAERDCSSACMLVLMGVEDRHAAPGAILRLHSATDATREDWKQLDRLGVPTELVEATQRHGTVNLRPVDMARMGIRP